MRVILSAIIALFWSSLANAQNSGLQEVFNQYIQIKEALVKSDSKQASHMNETFIKLLGEVNTARLTNTEKKVFEAEKNNLMKAAVKLRESKTIDKQRNAFADLSVSLWKVIKVSGISQVYYQYCPMKKAYWISQEAAIRNPYYGSSMLTCGKVTDKK